MTSHPALEEARRRLVERGAADGTVTDLGRVSSAWFEDPDGMGSEVCLVGDQTLAGAHEPRRLADLPA